jgi:SAM-dependent methyltransferase
VPAGIGPDRAALGLPDGFLFLFSFDFNSVFKRKNPLGAIEAFTQAFGPEEDVHLIVKSINGGQDPDNLDRLRLAAEPHAHVHLMPDYLSAADKERLTASCDAYVSLHRSEGFGIGMAEALLYDKPVIATGYGGNVDFLDESTGYPVAHEIVEVGADASPYEPSAHWAEPDLGHAAELMRHVVAHPDEAAERAARGAASLRSEHSPAAAGERMARRLETIRARRAEGQPQAAASNGAAPAGSPLRRLRRLPRKVARRVVRGPDRRAVVDDVSRRADAVVRDAVADLRREGALAQATDLAEMRRLRDRLDSTYATQHETQRQLEELRTTVARQEALLRGVGLGAKGDATPTSLLDEYPQAPAGEPWSAEYTEQHREFVATELEDPVLLGIFRDRGALPPGFGTGFDERVVEYPWLASRALGGTVLDAGSVLNHTHVLTRLRPRMDDLHIVTLAPEENAYPQLHVSYLFADLRDLPIADESYDRVVSVSTLEHVGMDNDYYGTPGGVAEDPQAELLAAVAELRRVLKPGGDLYVTVPVGEPDRFAWVRALSPAEIDQLVERFDPAGLAIDYFRHSPDGWQVSDREGIAGARYRDHFSSGPVGEDRAVAARAVACVHLTK